MTLLITSPVGLSSPRKEIEAWIKKLEQMKREHASDPDALGMIMASIAEARMWIELQDAE